MSDRNRHTFGAAARTGVIWVGVACVVLCGIYLWGYSGRSSSAQSKKPEEHYKYSERHYALSKDSSSVLEDRMESISDRSEDASEHEKYDEYQKPLELSKSFARKIVSDPVALFTIVLGIFTALLWYTTAKAVRDAGEVLAVARKEFLATHRPRLIVRDVDVVKLDEGWMIQFLIVNEGGSKATLVESWVDVEFPCQNVRNMMSTGHDDLGRLTFEQGEPKYQLCLIRPQFVAALTSGARAGKRRRGPGLWGVTPTSNEPIFIGALMYVDEIGNRRRSVFRRIFDPYQGGFVRSDNPDHEYAD